MFGQPSRRRPSTTDPHRRSCRSAAKYRLPSCKQVLTCYAGLVTSTRDALLTEDMRLFGEKGYAATSVAQIEQAAGLSPGSGSLYNHFRSKEVFVEAA